MSDGLRRCANCDKLLNLDAHGNKRHCTDACRQRGSYYANLDARRKYQREWQAKQVEEEDKGMSVAQLRRHFGLNSRCKEGFRPIVGSLQET
jgi:hypothetical protein